MAGPGGVGGGVFHCPAALRGNARPGGPGHGLALWAVWTALGCLAGCSGPQMQTVDHLSGPGLDEPLHGATIARWQADFERLIYDIPRAVKKLGWGTLEVRQVHWESPGRPLVCVMRATALLPDGRVATIIAWPVDTTSIAVAVQVGVLGDSRPQRALIVRLTQVLAGPRSRRHRQGFSIPEPVTGVYWTFHCLANS